MIVASISLSTYETNFSMQKHYLANPNSFIVSKFVLKVVSKFHDDPTINESEIIVLLGQRFGCMWKKRKLNARDIYSTRDIISKIPTMGV